MENVKDFPFAFLSQNSGLFVFHPFIYVFGIKPDFEDSNIIEYFFHQEI